MIGSRWTRPKYKPEMGEYNGYAVIGITNTGNEHPRHPPQVLYQGDNGHIWSLPLDEWPGNLIPEPTTIKFSEEDIEKIANTMITKYGFVVGIENMKLDMSNFSDALLNSLEQIYNVESEVYSKLLAMGQIKN